MDTRSNPEPCEKELAHNANTSAPASHTFGTIRGSSSAAYDGYTLKSNKKKKKERKSAKCEHQRLFSHSVTNAFAQHRSSMAKTIRRGYSDDRSGRGPKGSPSERSRHGRSEPSFVRKWCMASNVMEEGAVQNMQSMHYVYPVILPDHLFNKYVRLGPKIVYGGLKLQVHVLSARSRSLEPQSAPPSKHAKQTTRTGACTHAQNTCTKHTQLQKKRT